VRIATSIARLNDALRDARAQSARVAFVPTMGALHEGHLALVDEARQHADVVVSSIFVNPLQFGANEDLSKYPRTLEADAASLHARGVSVLFTPSPEEMYPPGRVVTVTAAPHDAMYEGAIRPGHFTGVLTVVTKLFNLVRPQVAVFGQKDLQQLSLIRRLVRDLDMPIEIVSLPTVREDDGLAMSSRNRYLSPAERRRASLLSISLRAAGDAFLAGEHNATTLLAHARRTLDGDHSISVDYLALVDPVSFETCKTASSGSAIILAARVGSTRLLDNIIL
jgi:pantoate--beta-alanine ligase